MIDKLIIGTLLIWLGMLVRHLVKGGGDVVLAAKVTLGIWIVWGAIAWLA